MQRFKKVQKQSEVLQRPLHRYLERMTTRGTNSMDNREDRIHREDQEQDLKSLILLKFSKTNENIKQVDMWLSLIENKSDKLEQVNSQLQSEMVTLREDIAVTDENALKKGFQYTEEAFADANRELEEMQACAENTDNFLRKNNLCLRGLQEYLEGNDLHAYLQQLFGDTGGADSLSKTLTFSAFIIGRRNASARSPRDVLIRFLNWESKAQALELISQNQI